MNECWLLAIEMRYADWVYEAFATMELANAALVRYVRGNWKNRMDGPMGDDVNAEVDRYFEEQQGSETYTMECLVIERESHKEDE